MAEWWKNEFYSQFGEDSILFAYFRSKEYGKSKRLDHIEPGFYVDIGAHHPYMISNTWFFYQRGWRGINVDPAPGTKKGFDAIRPRDITLEVGISDEDGAATLFSYERRVHNTLDGSRVDGSQISEKIIVPTLRLETLLDRYMPPNQAIDILSIDVEGLDLKVLRSNNWTKYRPEIVVSEHHEPSARALIASEMVSAMTRWGYELYAWAQPSLIFRRR